MAERGVSAPAGAAGLWDEAEPLTELVAALSNLPPCQVTAAPVFMALGQQPQLTLRVLREHSALLHAHLETAQAQSGAVRRVIIACQEIPPIPLPLLPLGF